MLLSPAQIRFLQSLVADQRSERDASNVAVGLAEHFSIGLRAGRRVNYTATDFTRASQLLVSNGIPVQGSNGSSDRAGRKEYTGHSEKTGSDGPHSNSVAIKVAHGAVLTCKGEPMNAVEGGYQVVRVQEALGFGAGQLMVVENLETLRFLERYSWIDYGNTPTLAVFRGDRFASVADCQDFLRQSELPVWGFGDFDPAGLAMSASLPRLERLVLPDLEWLGGEAKRRRRTDLYENSLNQWGDTLNGATRGEVNRAWKLLSAIRCGLPQEWMEEAPTMER